MPKPCTKTGCVGLLSWGTCGASWEIWSRLIGAMRRHLRPPPTQRCNGGWSINATDRTWSYATVCGLPSTSTAAGNPPWSSPTRSCMGSPPSNRCSKGSVRNFVFSPSIHAAAVRLIPSSGRIRLQTTWRMSGPLIEVFWSGPVVGIGISLGGNLLVRLAVAYPALVQGLVMAGTPLAQQGRRPIDQAQEFLRNNDLEGAVRFWGSLIFSEPGLRAPGGAVCQGPPGSAQRNHLEFF